MCFIQNAIVIDSQVYGLSTDVLSETSLEQRKLPLILTMKNLCSIMNIITNWLNKLCGYPTPEIYLKLCNWSEKAVTFFYFYFQGNT